MDDKLVLEVAKQLDRESGEIWYSWGIQRGTVVLPKSVTPSRIASARQVQPLPENAYDKRTSLESHKRFKYPAM